MTKINQNKLDLLTLIGRGKNAIDYKCVLMYDILPQILVDNLYVLLPVNLKNAPIWN